MSKNKDESASTPKSERRLRNEAVAKADALIRKAVFTVIDEQELMPSEAFYVFSAILADMTKIEMETQYEISGIEP